MAASIDKLVVVLGMHRAGTSLFTRGLQALGVHLGQNLLPADARNPKGYWENAAIVRLNDEILQRQGLTWQSACALRTAFPERAQLAQKARQLLQDELLAADARVCGFKDPRTARLLWFWQPVLAELSLQECYALVVRNPAEVVASLQAREAIPPAQGLLLWALHYLDAIAGSVGRRRVAVDYDQFLADPDSELEKVAAALELPLDAARRAAVAGFCLEFPEERLRHHRAAAAADEEPLSQSIHRLYEALRSVARGEASFESASFIEAFSALERLMQTLAPILELAARSGTVPAAAADGTLAARIDPRMPAALSAGEQIHLDVHCLNQGSRTWPAMRVDGVQIGVSYHLRNLAGEVLSWDNHRSWVTGNVPPDGVTSLRATFVAPEAPGDYLVEWDMLSENECWFQTRGSQSFTTRLTVTAADYVEPGRYAVQAVVPAAWSSRFRKPLEEVRVAIAVRTWNVISQDRRDFFERTLQSLQQAGHPFELCLVDNGSSDGTSELVASLGGHVRLRVAGQNAAGEGMNAAIERALATQPDLVVFSDDDIAWKPGFLRRLVEFWAHAPADLALMAGYVEPRWSWNTIRGAIDCAGVRAILRETAPGGAWTFPASNWRWIGPLPADMQADWAACQRLRYNGFRLAQADLATHLGADKSTWGNVLPRGAPVEDGFFAAAPSRG